MSMVGKTVLKGHGLLHEGKRRYKPDGEWDITGMGSAKCRCGELSPPGITTKAAIQWHREHKDRVRSV